METEKMSFARVCAEYEFAAWELAELVGRGEIAATLDGEGGMWFESGEILRFFRENPSHYFSLQVAEYLFKKDTKTLSAQASEELTAKLKAKKIGNSWAVSAQAVEKYIENYGRDRN